MMRSSILSASTLLNVLIQHLPLQSLFWMKTWRVFRASDPSSWEDKSWLAAGEWEWPQQLQELEPWPRPHSCQAKSL